MIVFSFQSFSFDLFRQNCILINILRILISVNNYERIIMVYMSRYLAWTKSLKTSNWDWDLQCILFTAYNPFIQIMWLYWRIIAWPSTGISTQFFNPTRMNMLQCMHITYAYTCSSSCYMMNFTCGCTSDVNRSQYSGSEWAFLS